MHGLMQRMKTRMALDNTSFPSLLDLPWIRCRKPMHPYIPGPIQTHCEAVHGFLPRWSRLRLIHGFVSEGELSEVDTQPSPERSLCFLQTRSDPNPGTVALGWIEIRETARDTGPVTETILPCVVIIPTRITREERRTKTTSPRMLQEMLHEIEDRWCRRWGR